MVYGHEETDLGDYRSCVTYRHLSFILPDSAGCICQSGGGDCAVLIVGYGLIVGI